MSRALLTTYDLLNLPGIHAFSTLRGCSDPSAPYDGFNTCHYSGDDPVHVSVCRGRLSEFIGIPPEKVFIPRQTHFARVVTVDHNTDRSVLEGVDALVSSTAGTALVIHTADCVPVMLADPDAGVIAAAHAGWRGAAAGIVSRTLEEMVRQGAALERILVAMGPCICMDCFEVGDEVAAQFPEECVTRYEGRRPHVDLGAAIFRELTAAGVAADNVAMPPECTRCNPERFFSARRLGVESGRIANVITLKEADGARMRR